MSLAEEQWIRASQIRSVAIKLTIVATLITGQSVLEALFPSVLAAQEFEYKESTVQETKEQ
ncbi:hypothetical protein HAX54_039217, partial [Datura stramonium]|nr:hypothetical protein [Datura stramonium]